jgi:hypothetical protein
VKDRAKQSVSSVKGCRAVGVLIQREVRLHRRVARRIDVPPSSGYVYHSRDWKILSDPLDKEVHRERLGQTVFIILVSERQVDHDAVTFIELFSSARRRVFGRHVGRH